MQARSPNSVLKDSVCARKRAVPFCSIVKTKVVTSTHWHHTPVARCLKGRNGYVDSCLGRACEPLTINCIILAVCQAANMWVWNGCRYGLKCDLPPNEPYPPYPDYFDDVLAAPKITNDAAATAKKPKKKKKKKRRAASSEEL